MFELREEGTIFGDKGRIIDEETYALILEKDKKCFKKVAKRRPKNLEDRLNRVAFSTMTSSDNTLGGLSWP